MMYGKFNLDHLCKVIEQIYNERDENIEYKVSIVDKEENIKKTSAIPITPK